MDPSQLLLVFLLLADPSAQPAADAVRQRLQDTAESARIPVRVVVGAEALTHLKGVGVTDADLMASAAVGDAFTRATPTAALIRIERRLSGGNVVIESRTWYQGRHESHVAIADGKASDPVESTARGLGLILAPWLTAGSTPDAESTDRSLARLADELKWHEVLNAPVSGSARNSYYRILALVRLGRTAEAKTELAALQTAHRDHLLTRAAEALVNPVSSPTEVDINNATPADDGSNVLR